TPLFRSRPAGGGTGRPRPVTWRRLIRRRRRPSGTFHGTRARATLPALDRPSKGAATTRQGALIRLRPAPGRPAQGPQFSKTPASTRRFSVASQPWLGCAAASAFSSARTLAPWPASASDRISATNASESVATCAVRPLVRLRTYACLPWFRGIRYLNSPSTLRAPPWLDWPARTDARAVLDVLLATRDSCNEMRNRGYRLNADSMVPEDFPEAPAETPM